MARPKQHHFVTRAYLEGFLNPAEEHLVCYGRRRGPFRKSPTELASRRNYYALRKEDGTWDDSVEMLIEQTVESPGLPVVKKLASGKHRLTRQERDSLALLISFQELRTPAARERTRRFLKLVNDRIFHEIRSADPNQNSIKIGSASGETTVTLGQLAKSHETICDDHSMEIHRLLMDSALKLYEYYRHMKFTVYHSAGSEEFITTDS